jgi:hypothetical protein
MQRKKREDRIKIFWPNVGRLTDYPQSIHNILTFIQKSKPKQEDTILWICREYGVVREFSRKLLNVLRATDVITARDAKYGLTSASQRFVDTRDSDGLFKLFSQKVVGFHRLLEILAAEGPLKLRDLEREWGDRMKPLTFAKNQCPIRYNWLRGFGYASLVAHQIFLTEMGHKLVTSLKLGEEKSQEKRAEVSHTDLEDKIKIIGEFFEFEAKKRASINEALPTYALKLKEGDRQLDCLWVRYIPFGGKVKFPVEIQLGGNLADSLDRLETVSQYVQRAIVVTTEDQEQTIIDRLKVKKSHLLDKLTIVFVEDVYKAVEAASVLSALAKRIFAD